MKYTLEMTREMERVMDQLVLDLNVDNYAQVLHQGIALLLVAQNAQDEGRTISITKDGKIEADLVL